MANVIICSEAELDFSESLKWYAKRSIEAANDFDLEFDQALSQISEAPERFPMCDARHRFFLLPRFFCRS
jgi:plasmid stabilization system protein ParE